MSEPQLPHRPGNPPAPGTDGHVPASLVDFQKVNWKTVRGSFTLLWPNGQSKSVDARNGRLGVPVGLGTVVGLLMHQAAYNSAAGVMFEVSIDDQTYFPLYDASGNRIEKSFTATTAISLDPTEFAAWDFVRVVLTDGSSTPVNSSGGNTAVLVVMRV